MKYVTAVVLYFVFWVAAVLSGPIGLLALPVTALLGRGGKYTANIMHSMDMLLAAVLGWNGRSTVSKECGRDTTCTFCKVLCKVLDRILEQDHCAKEVARD